MDYLEGVSEVRFALILVADTLNNLVSGASEHSFTAQADNLLRLAETVCSDTTINEVEVSDTVDAIGPNVYLLKLLVRQFGSARLLEISKACNWVLPPQLKIEQTVSIKSLLLYYYYYFCIISPIGSENTRRSICRV